MEEMYGRIFSESTSLRATIFQDGYKNATTLESIIKLMRKNNITAENNTSDSVDCNDDENCILKDAEYWSVLGVRGDIANIYREPYGIIDTKVVTGKNIHDILIIFLIFNRCLYFDVIKFFIRLL